LIDKVIFNWNDELESKLIILRDQENLTYSQIADIFKTTISSVKHKYIRLKQSDNDDKHHHPEEKIEQIKNIINNKNNLHILETNAGLGNLTSQYQKYGKVLALDIDTKKIQKINEMKLENVKTIKCDAFREIHRLIYEGNKFDVIDLDPYGYPSRYFPHIFQLINDGLLFVTFPKIGVQQINKITLEHYKVFWDISLEDKHIYQEKIHKKMKDFAMQNYRSCDIINSSDLGRMHRFAYKVKKESALDLVNLKVKGINY
jgi:16S rRNA G966 N2-methylase RsmD